MPTIIQLSARALVKPLSQSFLEPVHFTQTDILDQNWNSKKTVIFLPKEMRAYAGPDQNLCKQEKACR